MGVQLLPFPVIPGWHWWVSTNSPNSPQTPGLGGCPKIPGPGLEIILDILNRFNQDYDAIWTGFDERNEWNHGSGQENL